jgi:hypothetical protein
VVALVLHLAVNIDRVRVTGGEDVFIGAALTLGEGAREVLLERILGDALLVEGRLALESCLLTNVNLDLRHRLAGNEGRGVGIELLVQHGSGAVRLLHERAGLNLRLLGKIAVVAEVLQAHSRVVLGHAWAGMGAEASVLLLVHTTGHEDLAVRGERLICGSHLL